VLNGKVQQPYSRSVRCSRSAGTGSRWYTNRRQHETIRPGRSA